MALMQGRCCKLCVCAGGGSSCILAMLHPPLQVLWWPPPPLPSSVRPPRLVRLHLLGDDQQEFTVFPSQLLAQKLPASTKQEKRSTHVKLDLDENADFFIQCSASWLDLENCQSTSSVLTMVSAQISDHTFVSNPGLLFPWSFQLWEFRRQKKGLRCAVSSFTAFSNGYLRTAELSL